VAGVSGEVASPIPLLAPVITTSGQIRRIKHVEMLRGVTLCAIPSSHFTGFESLLTLADQGLCLKNINRVRLSHFHLMFGLHGQIEVADFRDSIWRDL
jgi:hypothetical protein